MRRVLFHETRCTAFGGHSLQSVFQYPLLASILCCAFRWDQGSHFSPKKRSIDGDKIDQNGQIRDRVSQDRTVAKRPLRRVHALGSVVPGDGCRSWSRNGRRPHHPSDGTLTLGIDNELQQPLQDLQSGQGKRAERRLWPSTTVVE